MAARLVQDLALLTPEVALTVTLLVALIADLIFRRHQVVVAGIVVMGLIVTGGFVLGQTGTHASIFSNMLSVDPFAWFFKLVVLLSALLVTVFSLGSAELNSPGRKVGEYYVLLVAADARNHADGWRQQPADDVSGNRAFVTQFIPALRIHQGGARLQRGGPRST